MAHVVHAQVFCIVNVEDSFAQVALVFHDEHVIEVAGRVAGAVDFIMTGVNQRVRFAGSQLQEVSAFRSIVAQLRMILVVRAFVQADTCLDVAGNILVQAVGVFRTFFRQPLDSEVQVFYDVACHYIARVTRAIQFLTVRVQVSVQPGYIAESSDFAVIFQGTEEAHFCHIFVDFVFIARHRSVVRHEIVDVADVLPVALAPVTAFRGNRKLVPDKLVDAAGHLVVALRVAHIIDTAGQDAVEIVGVCHQVVGSIPIRIVI